MIGLSHWKTPVDVREKFILSGEQIVKLIESAKERGINSILPISTCNRTEIYAIAEKPDALIDLLSNVSNQNKEWANEFICLKNSDEAVTHIFNVTAGLDSQILGDAQITGQIREFLQIALQHSAVGAALNRLIELALNAGKNIKTHSQLNNGASSIAHAAVRQGLALKAADENANALVIGLGKMGTLAVKSLLKFLPAENITVINRSNEKAIRLAAETGVNASEYDLLKVEISKSDLIFVATSSPQPVITEELLRGENLSGKIFIDLSLPRNIEPSLAATVISIDQLVDSGRREKENYIRLSKQFINEGISEYYEWLHRYQLAQNIKSEIHNTIFDNSLEDSSFTSQSKFVDGITGKYLRHFQKGKQSRNLAA